VSKTGSDLLSCLYNRTEFYALEYKFYRVSDCFIHGLYRNVNLHPEATALCMLTENIRGSSCLCSWTTNNFITRTMCYWDIKNGYWTDVLTVPPRAGRQWGKLSNVKQVWRIQLSEIGALLESLVVAQLVKKLPLFYGTRRFFVVFKTVRHCVLFCIIYYVFTAN